MLLKMKGTNMKRLMMAVTMAGALVCAAANQTYTWPDVGEELTVTYDTEDASKVKSILANVAKGDTVTIIGDAIPLAENPAITVTGGNLVISNALDGTGTLSIAPTVDNSTITWTNGTTYLQKEPTWTLIFPGKNLADWEPVVSYGPANSHNPNTYKIYNISRYVSNEVSYLDFQAQWEGTVGGTFKYTLARLKQTDDGIAAAVTEVGNFSRLEETGLGEDILYLFGHHGAAGMNRTYQFMSQSVESGGTKGYGMNHLEMKYLGALPTVLLEGLVTNSTEGAYMPVSVASGVSVMAGVGSGIGCLPEGSSIFNAGVFTAGGAFTADEVEKMATTTTNYAAVASSGTFRYERTADAVAPNTYFTHYTSGFLPPNGVQIVAKWCTLRDITNVIGKLTGTYIGEKYKDSEASMYHYCVAESGMVATGQVQFAQGTSTLRCLIIEFTQEGCHVGARSLWCCSPSISATVQLGTDTLPLNVTHYQPAPNAASAAYNIHEFTVYTKACRFATFGLSAVEDLAFAPDSAIEIAGSEHGRMQVVFSRTNSLPVNGTIDVFSGGDMVMDPKPMIGDLESSSYADATCRIRVHPGGTVYQWGNWTPGPKQAIELHGGTLHSYNPSGTSGVGKEFLNRLYLYDGATVTGIQIRVGHTPDGYPGYWKVRGTSPSHCWNTMYLESGAKNKYCEFKFDVADVTGDDEADFVMHGAVRRYTSDMLHTNILVRKTGEGTILLAETCGSGNEPMNRIHIEEGTWTLGASGTAGSKTEFVLKGGTLGAAAGTANSCGPLAIYAAGGAISLGEGATLTFADSRAMSWTATEKVTVYGFAERAIRFGESKAAAPHPRKFKLPDGTSLRVDKDGYLTAIPIGTLFTVQ